MAKEELLEFDGMVTEVLPDGNFRVKLDNDHEILAYTAGKMRKFRIRTGVGDRVIVEMSPYDLQRGRISFRHKSAAAADDRLGTAPSAVPAANKLDADAIHRAPRDAAVMARAGRGKHKLEPVRHRERGHEQQRAVRREIAHDAIERGCLRVDHDLPGFQRPGAAACAAVPRS